MNKTIRELGPREAEFLAQMASKTGVSFTIHEAIAFWGSSARAREKLSHLARKGWLERIERGKYLVVPLEAGTKRQWSENPYMLYLPDIHEGSWVEVFPCRYKGAPVPDSHPGRQNPHCSCRSAQSGLEWDSEARS